MRSKKAWAYVLIAVGVLMLIKRTLHLDVNVIMFCISLFLIYLGWMMMRSDRKNGLGNNLTIFSSSSQEADPQASNYTTIFGEHSLYFNEIQEANFNLEINTVFGETKVYIPKDLPIVIKSNAYFAESSFPDGREVNFGDKQYSQNINPCSHSAIIRCLTVFGKTKIIRLKVGDTV